MTQTDLVSRVKTSASVSPFVQAQVNMVYLGGEGLKMMWGASLSWWGVDISQYNTNNGGAPLVNVSRENNVEIKSAANDPKYNRVYPDENSRKYR